MSAPEFVVDIDPGRGATIRLSVHCSDLAPIDDEVERPLPSFLPADLDELRSGSCSERIAEALAEQVSGWLLHDDLRGHLHTALNAAAQPIRIILRPHPDVIPDLADIPFELLKLDTDPLALQPRVLAIVHTLHERRAAPAPMPPQSWPLRILLVRTNPADFGGKVRPVFPLRDHILEIARACGLQDVVEVTTLSSEPGADGPATYDALRAALRAVSYSLFVYFGHADLQDVGIGDLPPMGVLQFERTGSPLANPIRADQLRMELQNRPVPVVLLAGCLTAASGAAGRQSSQWTRGSRSVAQALIYGESGVRCAVGMRYRLMEADAELFIRAFFRSLLKQTPGDVERAVRVGREELFAQNPYPPSWSSPVLFRTASAEPLLDFLRAAPGPTDPLDEYDEVLRREAWRALSRLPLNLPPEVRVFSGRLLALVESAFLGRWQCKGIPVLWPARLDAKSGETVRVGVHQEGALRVTSLDGRLTFPDAIAAQAARSSPALKDSGFQALFTLEQPGEVRFRLRSHTRAPAALPSGPLFEVDLALPASFPAVYDLRTDCLENEPMQLLRGWSNAIVVPPP